MTAKEWKKSSYCNSAGLECLEFREDPRALDRVGVRDSKSVGGPTLTYGKSAWSAFVAHIPRASAS